MTARAFISSSGASASKQPVAGAHAVGEATLGGPCDQVQPAEAGTVVVADVGTANWVFHGNFQDYRDVRPGDLWSWLLSGSMYRAPARAV